MVSEPCSEVRVTEDKDKGAFGEDRFGRTVGKDVSVRQCQGHPTQHPLEAAAQAPGIWETRGGEGAVWRERLEEFRRIAHVIGGEPPSSQWVPRAAPSDGAKRPPRIAASKLIGCVNLDTNGGTLMERQLSGVSSDVLSQRSAVVACERCGDGGGGRLRALLDIRSGGVACLGDDGSP